MKLNKFIIFVFIVSISINAYARKEIREVYTNDRVIKPIYLALGRSTILKFREKPTNVVVGNKNYYNIEYINNDLTIQPLGAVNTNLFVYTENKRTYALLLKIVPPNRYDDIVHIRWKSHFSLMGNNQKSNKRKKIVKFEPMTLDIEGLLKIKIDKLIRTTKENSYFLQFSITNQTGRKISTNKIDIFLTRSNKRLDSQKLFFRKEKINKNEKTQARMFLSLNEKTAFSVNAKLNGKNQKIIISGKYL